jgi:hypothetical protein
MLRAWLDELREFDVRIAGAERGVDIARQRVELAVDQVAYLRQRRGGIVAALRAAESTLGIPLLEDECRK